MEMEQEDINESNDSQDLNLEGRCSSYAESIKNGHLDILKLIEQLKDLLTDQSPSKRGSGIDILTGVLKRLPVDSLTSSQLQVIAVFYSEKLKDHHQVLPSTFKGILTIIEFDNFPGGSVPALLNSFFQHVASQQQQKDDRQTIYRIFQILLRRFPSEVLSMKLDFVYGVMIAIDGERDPTNLLFLFKWLKIFLNTVELGHLTEDMFDSLSCYFPVDFRTPPNEKSITREALATGLSDCLCAIPDFGEYSIPLALEKLDSTLEIAKFDSLQLLRQGCEVFEDQVYLDKAAEFFSQIHQELFSRENSTRMKTECLDTLTVIVKKISQSDENEQYKFVLKNIVDSVKGNLLPESKFFETSSQILIHVALASKNSSSFVVEEVAPLLLNILVMAKQPDHSCSILKALVNLTECYSKYHNMNCEQNTELSKVPPLCLELLCRDDDSKKVGFETLTDLAGCLSSEVRLRLYEALRISIITDTKLDLRNSVLECLKALANLYNDEVKERVFVDNRSRCTSEVVDRILNAHSVLVNSNGYRDYVISNLLDCITTSEFAGVAIKNMIRLLEQQKNVTEISVDFIQKGLVDILVELAFSENADWTLLLNIAEVLKLLMRHQNSSIQMEILGRHLELVYLKTLSSEFNIIILNGIVSTLRRDIQVEQKVLDLSFNIAVTPRKNGGGVDYGDIARQLLANLINKRNDSILLNSYLLSLKEKCSELFKSHQEYCSVMAISWITKALLMRNHPKGIEWLDCLLDMIEQFTVTEALRVIMDDSYESMSSAFHCNKVMLYRQKAFVHLSNRFSRANTLMHVESLESIIEFTPKQAILLQFEKIYKLILVGLDNHNDPRGQCPPLLDTVKMVLSEQKALIEEHLEDFLSRILRLTLYLPNMKVRIKALECVAQFASLFPVYKLLRHKNDVMGFLRQSIDDRKRLVRKVAMDARHLWIMLDAPV